jgi:fido (protein-threonine AMPylation protein)
MAAPHEKLAASLAALMALQKSGLHVIQSQDLTRTHRERLLANGFLREIVKGWLMPSRPDEKPGDTTAWSASMRDFVRGYCDQKFDEVWCINPEQSIMLHTGSVILPKQIQINSPGGRNNCLQLPAGTSLFDYKTGEWQPEESGEIILELRVMRLAAALVRVSPAFFQRHPAIARQALWQLTDASELNAILLKGQHSVVAGRLAGALLAVGRLDLADDVASTLRAAGYTLKVSNPFDMPVSQEAMLRESPYAMRIRTMWQTMRTDILAVWGDDPAQLPLAQDYLQVMAQRYIADAYHSLSIEGYQVTPELIERVRGGQWNPDQFELDQQQKDAMAAKGYDLAHQAVRGTVSKILSGENSGTLLRRDHGAWFRALFAPSVQAGLLKPEDLAGYRNHQVFIRNSMHLPLPVAAVRDAMPVLFQLLENEPSGAVRAVLGHFVFVFIHPYMDGNGRIGRFLMNAMLAGGGYPWTIVTFDVRDEYMTALESASVAQDITPFARLLFRLMTEQLATPPQPRK